MNEGWKQKKLGEVCELLNRGISPKYLEEGGICVLNQKCIRNHQIDFAPSRRHDMSSKKVTDDRFIKLGDVLVNSTGTGTLGRVAQVRDEPVELTTVDSHVTIVRPKKAMFHLDFFGYMLVVIEDAIKESGEGCGGQTELARSVLAEKFFVTYPEQLSEQKRIVDFLDESLKGIAKAKANAEKNLKNARAIFESQLTSIFSKHCKEWTETTLGKMYDVRDGTHDSPKYQSTGYPLITSKNLKREGLSLENAKLISDQDYRKINERSAVHKGDVLFAMIGTIGNATLVTVNPGFAIKNVALFKISKDQNGMFLKYYLDSDFVLTKMMKEAKGTTQKFVGLGYLRNFPIWIPPLAKQLEVIQVLNELSNEAKRLETIFESKLAMLESLKKSLLHQAFSGNLKVSS